MQKVSVCRFLYKYQFYWNKEYPTSMKFDVCLILPEVYSVPNSNNSIKSFHFCLEYIVYTKSRYTTLSCAKPLSFLPNLLIHSTSPLNLHHVTLTLPLLFTWGLQSNHILPYSFVIIISSFEMMLCPSLPT